MACLRLVKSTREYYYELNERRDDSDHAKLSSDIYRLWQNAFIVGRVAVISKLSCHPTSPKR
jgi:hypothetical protein